MHCILSSYILLATSYVMNKAILPLVLVTTILCLFLTTTQTSTAQQQQQYNSTFFDTQNNAWSHFLPTCAMANMLLTNISTITYCHDVMQHYQNTLCQNPAVYTHIDACKLGLIKNFMVTYNHDGNLGE
jgi:tellurite resistance protein TehA-like permease